jgi:hypothetical protein
MVDILVDREQKRLEMRFKAVSEDFAISYTKSPPSNRPDGLLAINPHRIIRFRCGFHQSTHNGQLNKAGYLDR